MPVYCITARHSPLPRKRLIIEAEGEEEAVEMFLVENRDQAANRKKSGAKLSALVATWEAGDGAMTLDIEYAADDVIIDLPPPEERARKKAKIPPHLGRMGRRPDQPEVAQEATRRRRTRREAAWEGDRDERLLGQHKQAQENERPLDVTPEYPVAGMEERMAEKKPRQRTRKRPVATEGGVQVLGVPDDAGLPEGLDPLPDPE